MTEDFYAAAVPEQRRILGIPLRPFSLGHIILLNRVKSAFVCQGNPSYEDLAVAVLICSLSYEDGLEVIQDPDTPKFFQKLAEQLTGIKTWRVRLGLKSPRVIPLKESVEAFSEYVRENSKIPYYSFAPGDFKEMECPEVQVVKVSLMSNFNFSESELLNRSWSLCLWDYITLKALKGEVNMIDKKEVSSAQAMADKLAQMVKDGKIKPR